MARDAPWAALPEQMTAILRPQLATVVADVIGAISREVPSYARPLEGRFGHGVLQGVQVALERFLDLPGTDSPALPTHSRGVYVALGRGELRHGRTLEALLAAYRVGARVAFRGFAARAQAEGLGPDLLVPLAESIFLYMDELSAASVEGYASEQSERAGESERLRADLLTLLLSGAADPVTAADDAARVGWTAPAQVVAIALPRAGATASRQVRLGPEILAAPHGDGQAALAPAPRSTLERERLSTALVGRGAAVGPTRPLAAAGSSLRLAALAVPLLDRGVLDGDPVWVDEHLPALILHRDPEVVRELAGVCLAPLDALPGTTRDRLAATLLAWLRHRGERRHIAAELNVHAQTVGYRLNQLRDLFGPALDDPDTRFALELALRAERAPT
jgi:hypothetical protein